MAFTPNDWQNYKPIFPLLKHVILFLFIVTTFILFLHTLCVVVFLTHKMWTSEFQFVHFFRKAVHFIFIYSSFFNV